MRGKTVSDPSGENLPGPDDMQRILEEMAAQPGNAPDFMTTAIEAMAGVHARWYRGWINAGVPEPRAAEWAGIMIAALFRGAQ